MGFEVKTTILIAIFIKVRKEIERCYQLIHRLGRGVIYIGSARPHRNHPHYIRSLELSREASYFNVVISTFIATVKQPFFGLLYG